MNLEIEKDTMGLIIILIAFLAVVRGCVEYQVRDLEVKHNYVEVKK